MIKYIYSVIFLLLALLAVSCSGTREKTRPNILFCIADDQSYPHAGAYGCDWVKTPSFDRIAREGMLFTRAYTPVAKCCPSRSCIVTGRNNWQLEAAANHVIFFPPKFKTYAEALAEHGYFTGHTVKGWGPGVALTEGGEKRDMVGPPFNAVKCDPPTDFISGVDYAANFEAFLDEVPEGQPFCFWAGSIEPHRAYEFRSGVNKGGMKLTDIERVPDYWPDVDTVRNDMLDYAFEVNYWDRHVGRMVQALENRGLLDNTIVIATSDHGMPFPRVKGMPNQIANRVPLAIMWPGNIQAGSVQEDFVSFADFAPTFLELAGISVEESGMHEMEGSSLVALLKGESGARGREVMVFGKERTDIGRPGDVGYPSRGISDGDWVYIWNFYPDRWYAGNPETGYLDTDASPTKSYILNQRRIHGESWYWDQSFGKHPQEELYRISEDPCQLENLANNPEFAEQKKQLHDRLFAKLETDGDARVVEGRELDTSPYSQEKYQNFYEKYMNGELETPGWVLPTDFEKEPLD